MTRALLLLALFLYGGTPSLLGQQPAERPSRWAAEFQRFDEADRQSPPAAGGVVFVGSSSIRFWSTLQEDFPSLRPLNRGFGGSGISDVREHAERLIFAYRPRLIVLYAGENDIAAGRTARDVFEDYRAIAASVRQRLPDTRLVFVSIKPSPLRWERAAVMREANALVAEYAARDDRLDYVDVYTPMLGADGLPRPELYVEDRLHMTPEGYRVWRAILAPVVERPTSGVATRRALAAR
jgi:lysophospholipase L1-like esterase